MRSARSARTRATEPGVAGLRPLASRGGGIPDQEMRVVTAMGLSMVAVVLMAGTASMKGIVDYQQPGNILG